MLRVTAICLALVASCAVAPAAGAAVVPTPDTALHVAPPALGNDSTPTFRFSSDLGFSSFDCRYAATAAESWSTANDFPCGSATDAFEQAEYTPGSALGDGTRHFQVRACAVVDTGSELVEKCETSPARATFTIDTQAPPLSVVGGGNAGRVNAEQLLSFGSSEQGVAFRCRIDDGEAVPCGSPFRSGTSLSQGAHSMSVQAGDAAGNWSAPVARTFVWDTVAPVPVFSGPSLTKDRSPVIGWTAEGEPGPAGWAAVACSFGPKGGDIELVDCAADGWSPESPLADGTYELWVQLTDGLNTGPGHKHELTIDGTPPVIREILWSPGIKEISIDAEPGALECSFDGEEPYACGPYQAGGDLAPGPHTFTASVTDEAGNTSTKTIAFEIPDPDGPQDPGDPNDPQDPGTGGDAGGNGEGSVPSGSGSVPSREGSVPVSGAPVKPAVETAKKKAKKRCSVKKRAKKAAKRKRAVKRRCAKPRKRRGKRVARRS
jgi:hypothetical protein